MADDDRDGTPNLLEYAGGTPPQASAGSPWLSGSLPGGARSVSFLRDIQKTDVDLRLEWSPDLSPGSWQAVAASIAGGAMTPTGGLASISEATENGRVRVNATLVGGQGYVRLAASSAAASIPALPSGAVWRYDASTISATDGAGLVQWDDVSGNGRHVTSQSSSRPTYVASSTYNSRPAVAFSGTQYFSRANVNLSTTAGGGHTVVFVGRLPTQNFNFELAISGADGSWFGWQSNRVPTRADAAGATSNVTMGSPQLFDKCAVMAYRVKAGERKFWVGQTCVFTGVPVALPITLQLSHVGSYNNGGYGWQGELHEVLGYDRPLSDPEMAALVTHLEVKWNCDHEILVADGNSLVSGAAGGIGFPVYWRPTMGRNWWIPNFGVSAQTTATMMSDFATQVAPFGGARLDGKKNWLLAWELRNHLGSTTVDAAKAMYQQYCEAARTAGYKVMACTMIAASTGYTGNWTEPNRLLVNQWLRDNYTTFADALWDAAAEQVPFWTAGGDGIHITFAAEPTVAQTTLKALGLVRALP